MLSMLSAEYSCKFFIPIFFIQANSVDHEQTGLIWVHTVCKNDLKSQEDAKADDNCCEWQFKG